jgi:hypothetical protein
MGLGDGLAALGAVGGVEFATGEGDVTDDEGGGEAGASVVVAQSLVQDLEDEGVAWDAGFFGDLVEGGGEGGGET